MPLFNSVILKAPKECDWCGNQMVKEEEALVEDITPPDDKHYCSITCVRGAMGV